jgi:hypothetical protein
MSHLGHYGETDPRTVALARALAEARAAIAQAAAHVSGLVARLLSKHPHLRPYEVKTVLRAVAGNAVDRGASHDN